MAKFFDNATIAGVATVVIGAFVAGKIYRVQKDIDRKYQAGDKLSETLMILEEQCKSVNQNIDRLAGTYIRIVSDNDHESAKKFAESLRFEIDPMAITLMYKIPETLAKIGSITSLYFDSDEHVKNAVENVFNELKIWHDFTQAHAVGKSGKEFDLSKRVREVKELSLDNLNNVIKEVFNVLR